MHRNRYGSRRDWLEMTAHVGQRRSSGVWRSWSYTRDRNIMARLPVPRTERRQASCAVTNDLLASERRSCSSPWRHGPARAGREDRRTTTIPDGVHRPSLTLWQLDLVDEPRPAGRKYHRCDILRHHRRRSAETAPVAQGNRPGADPALAVLQTRRRCQRRSGGGRE